MPKPVLASVKGAAAGFGLSLVLAADLAIDGGKMDGFIAVMRAASATGGCPTDIPTCVVKGHESSVMGYHDARELPT